MKSSQLNSLLQVNIKYGGLEANIEGDFDEVWKTINHFLKEIKVNLILQTKGAIIPIKRKNVPEVLMELRNVGFFDGLKNSKECIDKLKELGKTDVTPNAVSIALKNLVERGGLKRVSQGRIFAYMAPYINFQGELDGSEYK
ncbi:MAG: hypothetical protein N3A69_04745 [Leptospiraceae bacterium]|nr:hypothetical protein [Leptospiraceae bacterium]